MYKLLLMDLSAFLFSIICCSGFSAIMPFRMALILLFILCMAYPKIKKMKVTISRSPVSSTYLLLVFYIAISVLYSYQRTETIKFLVVYFAGAMIILSPIKEAFHMKCLRSMESLCRIVAGSILIQIIVPTLYSSYLYFLISGGATARLRLAGEVSSNIYSGIVGEKGEAAFLMVVAIIIILAKCASEKKISSKNMVWLGIYFVAMAIPAKRMLFAVGILILMLYIMLWTRGNKKMVAISGAGVLVVITYVVMSMIPALNTLLSRFAAFSGDDTANGRIYLWKHAINMFGERKLLGYGYGAYNTYASEKGVLLTKSGEWLSQAHNIYYQLLGEMGLVGTTLFVLVCLGTLFMYFKLYQSRTTMDGQDISLMFVGVNLVILTLVYGVTGNVIYYTNQIMFFFWGISISVYLYYKYFGVKSANLGREGL